MTTARVAVQLEPAELDEFQRAARALLTHGLVTARFPDSEALPLVRRFEEPLRNELQRLCHWRLDVAASSARLLRKPASLSEHRPARTPTGRRFTPQAYASLCLVLAALEGLGEQTTISRLADEALRLCAGDEALPFDLTVHMHRRAFVDAVGWLQHRGVLTLLDGDGEAFLSGTGDALYDVDTDVASRLLVSPPSVLSGIAEPAQFLEDTYPPTPEGIQMRARNRVHRRLLTDPGLYYEELPPDEAEFARGRRTRIREELERLTGGELECRSEGQALIGLPSAEGFPAGGAVPQAALVYGSELAVLDGQLEAGSAGRVVATSDTDGAWARVLARYQGRFTAEYRSDPDRLRTEAVDLLARLDLAHARPDGAMLVRPAMARYRADIRLPETLFDG